MRTERRLGANFLSIKDLTRTADGCIRRAPSIRWMNISRPSSKKAINTFINMVIRSCRLKHRSFVFLIKDRKAVVFVLSLFTEQNTDLWFEKRTMTDG